MDDINLSNLNISQKDEVLFSEDKVALVSGGTRGIGRGICEIFKRAGATVIAGYASDEEQAKKFTRETNIASIKWDVSKYNECEKVVKNVIDKYGTVSILVNNAGITRDSTIKKMTVEQWQEVINVNLNSVFNMTKACLRHFLKNRNGSIINMSSVVGVKGNAGQSNYAASKSGIIGFSKSIALELGSRNIRCNVIAPGFIATEMTDKLSELVTEDWINNIPLKRSGNPVDVANVCIFLASDLSSYIAGKIFKYIMDNDV